MFLPLFDFFPLVGAEVDALLRLLMFLYSVPTVAGDGGKFALSKYRMDLTYYEIGTQDQRDHTLFSLS